MYIPTARNLPFSQNFFLSGLEKTLTISRQKFSFQSVIRAELFNPSISLGILDFDKSKSGQKNRLLGGSNRQKKVCYVCRLLKLFLVFIILMNRYYTKAKKMSNFLC